MPNPDDANSNPDFSSTVQPEQEKVGIVASATTVEPEHPGSEMPEIDDRKSAAEVQELRSQLGRRKDVANKLAQASNADVYICNAEMSRTVATLCIQECISARKRPEILFFLITRGGDAHAAYRIARCLQRLYSKVTIVVPGMCKSAGTLIALGAHELVMSDHAELGPLDVQMEKTDENTAMSSGLNTTDALKFLMIQGLRTMEGAFAQIKGSGAGITFRTATEIANEFTIGLLAPIYAQIQPLHVGEVARSINVAKEYGNRLITSSFRGSDALMQLIMDYPAHSFVIDRREAAEKLWQKSAVREPRDLENELIVLLGDDAMDQRSVPPPLLGYMSDPKVSKSDEAVRERKVTVNGIRGEIQKDAVS